MISVKCPHCRVGLKVDEGKLPPNITSFKCPKCKQPINISVLSSKGGDVFSATDDVTQLILKSHEKAGTITIMADENTRQQIFPLPEGINIIGRKSSQSSQATIHIETADRTMSREHIRIEVRKDSKGFKHFLSDNNSKNHTLYNSSYLEKGEIVILNNNDEIIIGNTTLRFNE